MFKTSPTHFLHNFLAILLIKIVLEQRFLKYSHSTATSRPPSFQPGAVLDTSPNSFYISLTNFKASSHSTFTTFQWSAICLIPPHSLTLSSQFPGHFILSNKAGIKGKDKDQLIEQINLSMDHSPDTVFLYTDGSALISSQLFYVRRKSYKFYSSCTGEAVVIYH